MTRKGEGEGANEKQRSTTYYTNTKRLSKKNPTETWR